MTSSEAPAASPSAVARDVATVGRISAASSILSLICRSTGLRFAAIARVTRSSWTACIVRDEISFGLLPGGELPVDTTICDEIRDTHRPVVIDHVAEDERFREHRTPKIYGFQSYISVPIKRTDGEFFGTLCALDPLPAKLSDGRTLTTFEAFADLIGLQIDAEEALQRREQELAIERQASGLREQFIAIIGHDLRNPLFAALSSAELLLRMPLDSRAIRMAEQIQRSNTRMARLVDNLLDFARGKLGGGINLESKLETRLADALGEVVAELLVVHPKRRVDVSLSINGPVYCDLRRIAQVASNLLANALTHGDRQQPISFQASTVADQLVLTIRNKGEPIPLERRAQLFQPYQRGHSAGDEKGLGLGLHISSQIVEAHGGSVSVDSNSDQTVFTATIPQHRTDSNPK